MPRLGQLLRDGHHTLWPVFMLDERVSCSVIALLYPLDIMAESHSRCHKNNEGPEIWKTHVHGSFEVVAQTKLLAKDLGHPVDGVRELPAVSTLCEGGTTTLTCRQLTSWNPCCRFAYDMGNEKHARSGCCRALSSTMFGISRLPYNFVFVVLRTVSQKAMDDFEGVAEELL